MAFSGSANISLNKNTVNGSRSRELRHRGNQEKISNECNINGIDCEDMIGANDGEENEEREAYINMMVEMKKRKNLEGVLNRLQKKKNKMDEVLKELLYQQEREQQRVKMCRYNLNCNLQSSRYEADGSEEDEIGIRSNSIKANLMNNYASDQGLCSKIGELEQLEANLKQVELQIRNLTTRDPDELMEMQEIYNHQRKREKARKAYNDDQINERVTSNQSSHRNDRSNALDGRKTTTPKRNDASLLRPPPSSSFDDGNRRALGLNGVDSLNNSMIDSNRPEASTPPSEDSLNDIEANLQLRDPFMLRNFFQNEPSDQNTLSHHQFFHLMLTQNYQILQQQQMLLLWLQQQSSHNHPPTCCRNCESVIGMSNFSPPPLAVWSPFTGQLSASNQASTSHLERNRAISSFGRLPDPNDSSTSPIACGKATPAVRPNTGSGENSRNNVPQNQLSSNEGSSSRSCFSKANGNLSGGSPHHRVGQNFNLHYSALSGIRSMDNGAQESQHSFPSTVKSNPVRKSSYPGPPSDHSMRKIKNTPLNDIHPPRCMPNGMRVSEKGKFMTSEKRDMSPSIHAVTSTNSVGNLPQTRVKSSNIPLSQIEDVAIGGDELQLNEDVDHMTQSSSGPSNVRSHPITLHISPSTGAIRKKLRNPDVIESASSSKSDKKDDLTSLLSETTRPLMAAEGRSSETNRLIVNGAPSMAPAKTTQASLLRLRQRPPTTGATSRDENEESISSSADDDLAEADQTAIELTESENLHSSSNMMAAMQGMPAANIGDSSNKVEPKSAEGEGVDTEDNEDDQISGRSADESGIRFSGDGEQGA